VRRGIGKCGRRADRFEATYTGLGIGGRKIDVGGLNGIFRFMRQVVIYPGEDGYWVVECPSLPGCISQGKTKESAIANIREAITLYIETLKEDGLPVPDEPFETQVVAV
jgi:predicted RNase H-like HicB family nuclease